MFVQSTRPTSTFLNVRRGGVKYPFLGQVQKTGSLLTHPITVTSTAHTRIHTHKAAA